MLIENTELEYTEAEGIILDYWLGGNGENKEQWAQRIWEKYPHTWEPNTGAFWLWEHKKRRRRSALARDINGIKIEEQSYCFDISKREESLEENIHVFCGCDHPEEIDDTVIAAIKLKPAYITKDAAYAIDQDNLTAKEAESIIARAAVEQAAADAREAEYQAWKQRLIDEGLVIKA